jgi:TolA-binding protein
MIRGNKGIASFLRDSRWPSASLAVGLLAMTFMTACVSCWAALDIFDRPRDTTTKTKIEKRQEEVDFLDYPKECLLKGNYKEALQASEKLLQEPAAAKLKGDIAYLVGLSLLKLDRFLEARRYFNDVLLVKNASDEIRRNALLGIADSYVTEESYDKAAEAYKKILLDYPDSPISCVVYFKLGETMMKLGNDAEAKYYLDKVRTEFPFSFEARLADVPPAPKIENIKTSVCETDTGGHDYYVQVGFFSEKNNADKLCEKLVRQGFDAYVSMSRDDYKARYRVKVGRLGSSQEALQLEKKLKRAGYSTKVCP